PLVETDFLVENPSTRGFTCLSAQLPSLAVRLKNAQCQEDLDAARAVNREYMARLNGPPTG
ncbi:hypothetical protein ACF09G_37390, partial [Streptomyces albogriseolus]|uniref:hypothetical protein n=1 Tax=Streptomyces albogriseolus TaxID=1887 RepID=UPI0036FF644F